MIQTKREEWEQACSDYPELSPFTLLKLSMVRYGAVLSPNALSRLQDPFYSFGKAEPFGISFEGRTPELSMPGPILLRDGSFVYINYGERFEDPYDIEYHQERGVFLLKENGETLEEVDFVPRPAFFGKKTSRGTPMEALADVRAQKLILTAYQRCRFWEGGDQCHFCAFFTGGHSTGAVNCQDIYETVREAVREPGRFSEIYLSGGSDFGGDPPFETEVERYIQVLQAIGRNFSGRFPSQLMAPAYPKKQLKRIYDQTGVTSYCPNIEVWDENIFRHLCPGKEKWIGHKEWVRRTLDAVEIFGRGQVCTQVISGVELAKPYGFSSLEEALESNFQACDFFARHGVSYLSVIWHPHKASRLGFQPVPPLEYYIRLAKGLHEIRRSYGLVSTNDDYKRCGNHPDSDFERFECHAATA